MTTLEKASAISRFAWDRRHATDTRVWSLLVVKRFRLEMDRAGYLYDENEYQFNGTSIMSKWDQLFQWAESIAQNERDTARGL